MGGFARILAPPHDTSKTVPADPIPLNGHYNTNPPSGLAPRGFVLADAIHSTKTIIPFNLLVAQPFDLLVLVGPFSQEDESVAP